MTSIFQNSKKDITVSTCYTFLNSQSLIVMIFNFFFFDILNELRVYLIIFKHTRRYQQSFDNSNEDRYVLNLIIQHSYIINNGDLQGGKLRQP